MKKVNLLPWRAQVRSTQKKQFWYVMTSVFAVALAIDMFTHIIFAQRLDNQVQQNNLHHNANGLRIEAKFNPNVPTDNIATNNQVLSNTIDSNTDYGLYLYARPFL